MEDQIREYQDTSEMNLQLEKNNIEIIRLNEEVETMKKNCMNTAELIRAEIFRSMDHFIALQDAVDTKLLALKNQMNENQSFLLTYRDLLA